MKSLKSFVEDYSVPLHIVSVGRDHVGPVLEATTLTQLAVVEDFMRKWFFETGYGLGVEITYPGRKYYLVLKSDMREGSKSIAIGAMEISEFQSGEPFLEWIWLHPMFRKETPKGSHDAGFAAIALSEILKIYPKLKPRLSPSLGPAHDRIEHLWKRVSPAVDG